MIPISNSEKLMSLALNFVKFSRDVNENKGRYATGACADESPRYPAIYSNGGACFSTLINSKLLELQVAMGGPFLASKNRVMKRSEFIEQAFIVRFDMHVIPGLVFAGSTSHHTPSPSSSNDAWSTEPPA